MPSPRTLPTRRLSLAILAFALSTLSTGLPSAARAATVQVTVGGASTSFNPQTVAIEPGDTVVWTNAGGIHDTVADDGGFSSGAPSDGAWSFQHTFPAAGTFGYHCTVHGAPGAGMFGTVVVSSGADDPPGSLRFSQASYSVNEGGAATITVQRINGDDGAVSVSFSATAGSATAGADFTPVSGTLTWPDNDDDPRSFTVATAGDSAPEPNETVQLTLSSPTGGATLANPSGATLTLLDDDGGTPGRQPAAPSNLVATASSTTGIALAWTDNANNETGFSIEQRTIAGDFQQVATVGPNATALNVTGLSPSSFYLFRVRALGSGGTASPYSNVAGAATLGEIAACVDGSTVLCLNEDRFRVEVDWRIPDGTAGEGQAIPLAVAPDSGLFYFFQATNIEMLLKVLNACGFNQRYWVFFSATTNVELAVVVTDTETGASRGYYNPLGRPAPPVQDTNAFATCP